MRHLILLSIFAILFAVPSLSQDKADEVVLPDSVMKDVLRKIAASEVKPPKDERLIHVANQGLGTDWLPEIKDVDFVLLDKDSQHRYAHDLYFWKDLRKQKDFYLIDFGYGDVYCSAHGSTWVFRVVDGEAKDIRPDGGWGSAC